MALPQDCLQKFILNERHIRGQWICLNRSYRAIQAIHPYPMNVAMLIGEALAATALISGSLKYQGRTTLQIQGTGPLQLLLAQCSDDFHLRGLARWDEKAELKTLTQPFKNAQCLVSISQAASKETYDSIIALDENDLAQCLKKHFEQSEQLPSYFCFASTHDTIVGFMLQTLPSETRNPEDWQHVECLTETLTQYELLNLDPLTLVHRLFHEEDLLWFNAEEVQFKCSCSKTKSEKALVTFGETECLEILMTNLALVVHCDFCNQSYEFDKIDVHRIFHGSTGPAAPTHH